MEIKVPKNETEYRAALNRLEALMDAAPDSGEQEELEVLAVLIEAYEDEHFPIPLPDPVEAIKFRMDQQGLSQKDLIAYIGSQGKVSEVLNRKRPLSLTMIRNLHEGLGIPAEVLIQSPGGGLPERIYNPKDFPFTEMFKGQYFRGFPGELRDAKLQAEKLLADLFSVFGGQDHSLVYCRNSEGEVDSNALMAWSAQVLKLSSDLECAEFRPADLTIEKLKEVARLSVYNTGPLKARQLLARLGIPVVILEHLPHTYLDGACFLDLNDRPVIGLTLRHNRLDNFWFTLMHELSHVYLHLLHGDRRIFCDDTERLDQTRDESEMQADQLTADLLIAPERWAEEKERLFSARDSRIVIDLAENLGISPAIIAGRVRYELRDYALFNHLLGAGEVKYLFEPATA